MSADQDKTAEDIIKGPINELTHFILELMESHQLICTDVTNYIGLYSNVMSSLKDVITAFRQLER